MTAQKNKTTVPTPPLKILEVFGIRVKKERNKKKITQEELAESVGVSDDTIKRIESGKGVKLEVAFNIAEVLCIPIQSLLPQQDISKDELTQRIMEAQETLQLLLGKI